MGNLTATRKNAPLRGVAARPALAGTQPHAAPPVGLIRFPNAAQGKRYVVDLRRQFGVSQEEMARVTGYSTRSVAGWEAGKQVSVSARHKLVEAARLREALAEVVGQEALGEWMRTPNEAFEGQTPIQIIERGESDRLWRMVFQIKDGVAS